MKKGMRKALSALLLVVFLASTGLYVRYHMDYAAGGDTYSDAEDIASQTEASQPPSQPEAEKETTGQPEWIPAPVEDDPNMEEMAKKNLAALRETNPDVVGWIWIPDTVVNYPVMQGEDNEFYLEHTWEKEKNAVGSIFLEWQVSPDFSEFNTIVYGHNMLDGSMFHLLHDYREEGFREAHPYVYVLTDAGVYRYEVFSTYKAEVGSKTYSIGMQQDRTKQQYIDMALEESVIDAGITPAVTDRILTLSTCSGMGYETRWVVHAYLPMELVE